MNESKWAKLFAEFAKELPDKNIIKEMKGEGNWWIVIYGDGKERRLHAHWKRDDMLFDLVFILKEEIPLLFLLRDAIGLTRHI